MSYDPKGTAPGLVPNLPANQTIHMKCRNEKCDSMSAISVQLPGEGTGAPYQRLYRCVKCTHQWGLNVGGHINI